MTDAASLGFCLAAAAEVSAPEMTECLVAVIVVLMAAVARTVVTEEVVGVDLLLSRSEHEWPANRRNWRSGIYANLYKGICIYVFLSYICVLLI